MPNRIPRDSTFSDERSDMKTIPIVVHGDGEKREYRCKFSYVVLPTPCPRSVGDYRFILSTILMNGEIFAVSMTLPFSEGSKVVGSAELLEEMANVLGNKMIAEIVSQEKY